MLKKTYALVNDLNENVVTFGFGTDNPDEIIFLVKDFWGSFKVTSPKALGDLTDFAEALSSRHLCADIEVELNTSESEIYYITIKNGEVGIMASERIYLYMTEYSDVKLIKGTIIH